MHRPTCFAALAAAALASTLTTACIPYAVGSTARTVPAGDHVKTTTAFIIPNGVENKGDSVAATIPGLDSEVRFGIDNRSDWGVRVPSWSGVVINYKRRLDAVPATAAADTAVALSLMTGGGVINWGQHAHLELSLLASGREDRKAVPYGGIRVMQAVPLNSSAPGDRPTAGAFVGWRIGSRTLGVAPEIGVFYDHSALQIRRSDVIVVPSITFYGPVLSSIFH
jgi:hypothetical protein